MATYYNGSSEIQGGDGLQTLVLMNPRYVYYPDAQQSSQPPPSSGNFMFLDTNHPGNNPATNHHQQHANMTVAHLVPGAPPSAQTQQFVGIPFSASPSSSINAQFIPRAQYVYNPVEMVVATPPREVTPFQQGLSLSLSSQQSRYGAQATRVPISPIIEDGRSGILGGATGASVRGASGSTSSASGISNNVNGMHNMLSNSKYLKATQELLEEVVSVGKLALKNSDQSIKNLKILGNSGDGGSSSPLPTKEGETVKSDGTPELTTAERQEIQMKKAKLINMLDEVEQRYRQYHHQMQIVISWFEQAAGIGSAKTYTSLALQTISKQFRCLKDAIMSQIKAAHRSLGEDDSLPGGGMADYGGSRLKFVDNQLRQQRALQQLGMIQHNAWRPQRGLPERSVSVLRAWLFEHFLHPYPKDSDKHMLAKQTGLTRSQVSNWFINARVRLWKPMVEEMYLEEIKQHEQSGNDQSIKRDEIEGTSSSKQGKTESPENSNRGYHPPPAMAASATVSAPPTATGFQFHHNPSGLIDGIDQFSPKKPRTNDVGFINYPMGEIGRFTGDQYHRHYSGNGVSLTLGLPHCENLSISGSHRSFELRRAAELGEEDDYTAINPSSSSHTAAVYDSMNIQNRKRFAAQPISDFVA